MTQKIRLIVLSLLVVLPTIYTRAAFYSDASSLPVVTKLVFGAEQIGLYVEGIGELKKPAFILDRSNDKFRSATESEFATIFGDGTEPLPYDMNYGKGPFVTTDGTSYFPYPCNTDAGVVTERSALVIAGRTFPITNEYCLSISDVEIDEGIVWIGTFYDGDDGDYGAAGLVASSYETGEELGRIDTGKYPITHVRIDPYNGNIWALTTDRVVVVRRNLEVESSYVFYYDFDSKMAKPELYIANRPTLSHPLAVFAKSLPSNRHEEFYEAVQTIPDNIARKFSLYWFNMCCSLLRKGEEPSEPEELEILIPFLLSGFEHSLPRWKSNDNPRTKEASQIWRQIACKHRNRNEKAEFLCSKEDWGDLLREDLEQHE